MGSSKNSHSRFEWLWCDRSINDVRELYFHFNIYLIIVHSKVFNDEIFLAFLKRVKRVSSCLDDYNDSNDSNEIIEQLKKDNEALKSDVEAFRVKANLLDELLTHVNENAYIDFNGFRDDEELRYKLKNIKQNEGGVTFE